MNDRRKIWLTVAVVGMVVITGMAYTLTEVKKTEKPAEDGLSLTLKTDRETYQMSEEITATATLRNGGNEAISVDNMSTIYANLQLYLILPNSTELQYSGLTVDCLPQKITLKPGETITEHIVLMPTPYSGFINVSAGIGPYYDFSQNGEYTLHASYRFYNGNCSYEVLSNEWRFAIV